MPQLGRVDAVVHAVGGFAGGKPIAETDDATLERMLDLNFKTHSLMRAAIPQLRTGLAKAASLPSQAGLRLEPGPGVRRLRSFQSCPGFTGEDGSC